MAVIAVAAIGPSIGIAAGTAGALALGAVAALADSQFIFPLLQRGAPDIEGPRLDDLSVQGAAEGSPQRWAIGPEIRSAGSIIWSTDLQETRTTSGGGGGKGGGGGGGTTNYSYALSFAVHVCDTEGLPGGAIERIDKIWLNTKPVYDFNAGSPTTDSRIGEEIRVYNGDQTAVDFLLELSDPGKTPAYKDGAYYVIEELQLADFSNRLPNAEMLYHATADGQTIADAIDRICTRGGLAAARYDTSAVTGTLRGILTVGEQEMGRVLEYLLLAFNIAVVESNGKLVFSDRDQTSPIIIDNSFFGATEYGSSPDSIAVPFSRSMVYDDRLPRKASVRFIDPDCDYEQSSRIATKTNATTNEFKRVDLPLTLDPDDASEIAFRTLWTEWGIREEVEGTLPPSFIDLNAGQLISVVDDGVTELIRLASVNRGENFQIKFVGMIEEPGIFDQFGVTEDRACVPANDPVLASAAAYLFITDHMVTDRVSQWNTPVSGFYFAASNNGTPDIQTGTFVPWVTKTSGSGYKRVRTFGSEGPHNTVNKMNMGFLLTAIPAAGAENGGLYWDNETTFDFESLSSAWVPTTLSDEDVLEGRNHICLNAAPGGGCEVIGFATVESIGVNQYRCSRLLRGRRATDIYANSWSTSTILVDMSELDRVTSPTEENAFFDWSQTDFAPYRNDPLALYWKGVPTTTNEGNIPETEFGTSFGVEKPFPAATPRAYYLSNGDTEFGFHRRTRAYHNLFTTSNGFGGVARPHHPLLAFNEISTFEVDVYEQTNTTVARTFTITKTGFWGDDAILQTVIDQDVLDAVGMYHFTYTESMRSDDGYATGEAVHMRIYQRSQTPHIYRGHPLVVSI